MDFLEYPRMHDEKQDARQTAARAHNSSIPKFFFSRLTKVLIFFTLQISVNAALAAVEIRKLPATGPQPQVETPQGRKIGLYKESHALLISVSDYIGAGFNKWQVLSNTAAEMDGVAIELQAHGFDVWRVSNPTSSDLHSVMRDFMAEYGHEPDSRLLFFFSGHGYTNPKTEIGYLVPADAGNPKVSEKAFYSKAIPILQLELWAKELEARHALFLFDSCFSGTIFATRGPFSAPESRGATASERWRFLTTQSSKPVRQFIAAGGANEKLPATSIFVPMLLEALNGTATTNKDGYVTGKEIGMWIEQNLPNVSNSQTPHSDVIRDVKFSFGDMVFQTKYSSSSAKPESTNNNSSIPERTRESFVPPPLIYNNQQPNTSQSSIGVARKERRSPATILLDEEIRIKIQHRVNEVLGRNANVKVQLINRAALMTGTVPSESDRQSIERAAAGVSQLRTVVNETAVLSNIDSASQQRNADTLILEKLVDSLPPNMGISPVVERGTVYLMGLVTEEEAAQATDIARSIPFVVKVVRVFEIYSKSELARLLANNATARN